MRQRKRRGAPQASIQTIIMISFTLISVVLMAVLGATLYSGYTIFSHRSLIDGTQSLMVQTVEGLENYLLGMRQISDAAYYNVVREYDLSDRRLLRELGLLYEANKSAVQSIALYSGAGSLLGAVPVDVQKEDPDVTRQAWFVKARGQIENLHFSSPHVQNLFEDAGAGYDWVISLSRAVELADRSEPRSGVLLVDMKYEPIARQMEQINRTADSRYYYLIDDTGKLIYHPRQLQLRSGFAQEDASFAVGRMDGVYTDTAGGVRRDVVVETVSYTGWKLVGVLPPEAYAHSAIEMRFFILMMMALLAMMLLLVNRLVSARISRPLLRLSEAVEAYEKGGAPDFSMQGSTEIRHLGRTLERSYRQIEELMEDIVREQNERRRSELDALQSQINPHFLYNTLDSITWMVEGGRDGEAVRMISELAGLLRISLSNGRTIISVADELRHARSYMHIQKIRYRERFSVSFDCEAGIGAFCTVKLVVQPLLENAIYYGVGEMEEDEGGKITVTARRQDDVLLLTVSDNGTGIPAEKLEKLRRGEDDGQEHRRGRGSGVGLANVRSRLRLFFGEAYGLTMESEPDCGTSVTLCLPAIPFTEENRLALEEGRWTAAGDLDVGGEARHEKG